MGGLGLPNDCDSPIQRQRVRILALFIAEFAAVAYFPKLGSTAYALRSVAGSVRCVSAGFNSYAAFSHSYGALNSILVGIRSSYGALLFAPEDLIVTIRGSSRRVDS